MSFFFWENLSKMWPNPDSLVGVAKKSIQSSVWLQTSQKYRMDHLEFCCGSFIGHQKSQEVVGCLARHASCVRHHVGTQSTLVHAVKTHPRPSHSLDPQLLPMQISLIVHQHVSQRMWIGAGCTVSPLILPIVLLNFLNYCWRKWLPRSEFKPALMTSWYGLRPTDTMKAWATFNKHRTW